jgi:hypothetical protein
MERPTKELVDRWIRLAGEGYDTDAEAEVRGDDEPLDAYIHRVYFAKHLAIEVVALREELDEAKGATLYHICLELGRQRARVEALARRWRGATRRFSTKPCLTANVHVVATYRQVLDELQAALRGEP